MALQPDLPRTIRLVERRPRRVRLARRDIAFLLREHRTHLELLPTGRRGVYRVTARGFAGVIVAPTCRLLLRPKLPLRHLCYLLEPDADPPAVPDFSAADAGFDLLDLLAGHLARLLEERAAAGLHRAYVEEAAQGPALQGRLDVAAQVRAGPAGRDRFHVRRQEFTADNPCNRVPKATAEWLLATPMLAEPTRHRLRAALASFDTVAAEPLTPELFAAALADPRAGDYRALLALCQLLADGRQPEARAGEIPAPAFLFNMDQVFERYLTRGLQRRLGDAVEVQRTVTPHPPAADRPALQMRPDLIVRGPAGRVIVDAKWKRLRRSPLRPADVYQVLAYAAALGAARAVLVYPGRHDRVWHYPLDRGPALEVRTLRVIGEWPQLERSLGRLARAVTC
jgi:hypothetical protein